MLDRLRDYALDFVGWFVLIALGAVLTTLLFLLRIIPDRDKERAEAAHKAADARIAAIRAKIAAAKAERDAAAAAERAAAEAAAAEARKQSSVQTANEYIKGKR